MPVPQPNVHIMHSEPVMTAGLMSLLAEAGEFTRRAFENGKLDPGPLRVGSRAVIRQPRFPPALWTATEVEPSTSGPWNAARPSAIPESGPSPSGSRVSTRTRTSRPPTRHTRWPPVC